MANGFVRLTKTSSSGGAGVTAVTGTAPVVSSGGATPAISMPVATTGANGYLSSTKWNDFNRKFGGFIYNVFTGSYLDVPISGQALLTLADSDLYEVRISYTTLDGITGMSDYFINNKVGGNGIIISNNAGQESILLGVDYAVDNGTYCSIPVSGYIGADPISAFSSQGCTWTFTQNPELATINGSSIYGNAAFTTSYAMASNLNGTTISVGTVFIGIGSGTSNATEANRSVVVATGIVTYVYLRISGTMTGSMVVTLMKNGVATAMTFSIPVSSPAGKYTTTLNQQSVSDGDELSLRIVQSTATSSGVLSFGFIIT